MKGEDLKGVVFVWREETLIAKMAVGKNPVGSGKHLGSLPGVSWVRQFGEEEREKELLFQPLPWARHSAREHCF